MILIHKKSTPQVLSLEKARGLATYDDMHSTTKNEIKKALLEEQGHLCAYCMCSIAPESTTIEHYHSISNHSSEQLDYTNMLAVCPGGEGSPPELQTCDEKRGNIPLTVNPLKAETLTGISYGTDGTISSNQPSIQKDFNETLNLNLVRLKRNRKSALDSLKKELYNGRGGKPLPKAYYEKYLTKLQQGTNGKLPRYCGILTQYLEKKIAHATR